MLFEIEDARVVGESEEAILVEVPELEGPIWIPKSQIDDDSEVYKKGTEGILIISEWLAEQKGWL
jgi:hypothetical protein